MKGVRVGGTRQRHRELENFVLAEASKSRDKSRHRQSERAGRRLKRFWFKWLY